MNEPGLAFLVLAACVARANPTPDTGTPNPGDADGDGFGVADDCDDADPAVNAGAAEACANAVDDDCDGHVDGGDDDCPLEGQIGEADADGTISRAGLGSSDRMPHAYPGDGRLALFSEEATALAWYDYEDALAGTWTRLGEWPLDTGNVSSLVVSLTSRGTASSTS